MKKVFFKKNKNMIKLADDKISDIEIVEYIKQIILMYFNEFIFNVHLAVIFTCIDRGI